MKNVRVTIDEATLNRVDRVSKPLGLTRSAVVRQALKDWLRRHAMESFERDWIRALEERPDEPSRAERWLEAQSWGDK